jgi:hypothetical protein
MPECSSTPRMVTFSKRDSSAAAFSRMLRVEAHAVSQLIPSRRRIPFMEASSRRSCQIAPDRASGQLTRGAATRSSCSMSEPTRHDGSRHGQRR